MFAGLIGGLPEMRGTVGPCEVAAAHVGAMEVRGVVLPDACDGLSIDSNVGPSVRRIPVSS